MKIAIDLDGVLVDIITPLLEFHNEIEGTNHSKEDVDNFVLSEFWNLTPEETEERVHHFYETDSFRNLHPEPEAKQAVQELSEEHELCIVTSRPVEVEEETRRWIEEHFPDAFDHIHFSDNPTLSTNDARSKAEICSEIEADVLIEDAVEYAEECSREGIEVFLLDKPWNQKEELPDRIIRVHSWGEVLRLVRGK